MEVWEGFKKNPKNNNRKSPHKAAVSKRELIESRVCPTGNSFLWEGWGRGEEVRGERCEEGNVQFSGRKGSCEVFSQAHC